MINFILFKFNLKFLTNQIDFLNYFIVHYDTILKIFILYDDYKYLYILNIVVLTGYLKTAYDNQKSTA